MVEIDTELFGISELYTLHHDHAQFSLMLCSTSLLCRTYNQQLSAAKVADHNIYL